MIVFLQLLLIWILMGIALGLVARSLFKTKGKLALLAIGFLPWLIHLLITIREYQLIIDETAFYTFLTISVIVALMVFWVGLRSISRQSNFLAIIPLVLLGLYLIGPINWLSESHSYPLSLENISLLMLAAGSLSTSVLFLTYRIPLPSFNLKARVKRVQVAAEAARQNGMTN